MRGTDFTSALGLSHLSTYKKKSFEGLYEHIKILHTGVYTQHCSDTVTIKRREFISFFLSLPTEGFQLAQMNLECGKICRLEDRQVQ